jgi:1-acyl-sn-glycerol-3-phosphate acyltransferase
MADQELVKIKEQVYVDPRPAEYFTRFHERARTREPDWVYEATRVLTSWISWLAYRLRTIGADRVPASGPVILAPNHFSFMDHFFLGVGLRRRVRFMAKSQLFAPPVQWVYTHGGVFPVRRGKRDEEAFITARTILGRGGCVVMYCEGGRSRTGQLSERAKPGIGRLALETGAVVVPVAIHGSARVRNWKKLEFPKVTVLYGEPFRYEAKPDSTREEHQAVADEIFGEINELYARLDSLGRKGAIAAERARHRVARSDRPAAV